METATKNTRTEQPSQFIRLLRAGRARASAASTPAQKLGEKLTRRDWLKTVGRGLRQAGVPLVAAAFLTLAPSAKADGKGMASGEFDKEAPYAASLAVVGLGGSLAMLYYVRKKTDGGSK